jgi:hypothetical protein
LGGWPTVQRTTCQYGRQHGWNPHSQEDGLKILLTKVYR